MDPTLGVILVVVFLVLFVLSVAAFGRFTPDSD